MPESRFIGRDRELAQLDLAIGPLQDGLRVAMLSGPSGLGKTTLATHAVDAACARGFRSAVVRGRAGSLSTPFAPFIEAMPEFEVLLSVLAGDSTVDIEFAGIGLVNLLAELTTDQPLLLVFDDAQALDESSIALLPFLSGVSERMDLTLLFVEQTDAIDIPSSYRAYVDGLLARRVVGHLRLGPMADDSIRELVAHELELEGVEDVPTEIVERAKGNPWFAKELAHGWQRGATEIPTTIAAAATARLHALPEIGQDIVSAVALCVEGAHIGWLEALADQKPREFVRTMEAVHASGIVREDGDVLTIAHPLMQQALVDELSAAMRRAIHLEIAEVVGQVPLPEVTAERARGQHLQGGGRTDEAVAHFLNAADANEMLGQLHEAYSDVVRALDAEPRVEKRMDLLRRCATLAMQVDRSQAERYWTELGRIAAGRGDNEAYAFALFQQYWTCNDGQAQDRLERAANLGAETYGWSARAAANIASLDADFVTAEQHDRVALEIAKANGDAVLETMATYRLGVALGMQGRHAESVPILREAISLSVLHRQHEWAVKAWSDLAEDLSEDMRLTEALTETANALKYVDDLGLDQMRPCAYAWHASALISVGDLDSATENVELAQRNLLGRDYDQFAPLVAFVRARALSETGAANALDAIDQADVLTERAGFAAWRPHLDSYRARASWRAGKLDAALALMRTIDLADDPAMLAEVALWWTRGAALAPDDAALAYGRELLAMLTACDASGRYVVAATRELTAMYAAIDGGPTEPLSEIAAEWDSGGRALDAVRVIAAAGALDLRAGRRDRAQEVLKVAKDGLQKCGASADADLVASLLRQTGARSRAKSRTTNVGPLTKRELEIARLVASGLKNSEVASSLFLAEKTVAAHLSNIYGKVEVRSRVQLTAWIREHDPEFEASLANAG